MAFADMDMKSIVVACAALLAVVAAGAGGALWLRRRFCGNEDRAAEAGGFTLSQLRELHRAGRLTSEEFERAKATVVAATQRQAARLGPAKKPPGSASG